MAELDDDTLDELDEPEEAEPLAGPAVLPLLTAGEPLRVE